MKEDTFSSSQIAPPAELQKLQEWFASFITTPLNRSGKSAPITSKGAVAAKEAPRLVKPSATLSPHLRLQIYNQQYWWRLFKTLQVTFPFVLKIVGVDHFNEKIAKPYLLKYPSNDWSINWLGKELPDWLESDYRGKDRSLLASCAALDWAFVEALVQPSCSPLTLPTNSVELEKLFETPLRLQPHMHLFHWEYNLMQARQLSLQEGSEEKSALFSAKEPCFVLLFRSKAHNIMWKSISLAEWMLLKEFQKGASIASACRNIEAHHPELSTDIAAKIQHWIAGWIQNGWLYL